MAKKAAKGAAAKKKRTVSGRRGKPGRKNNQGTDTRGVVGIVVFCIGFLALLCQFIPSDGGFLNRCMLVVRGLGGMLCLLLPVVSKRLLRNSSGVFEATRTKASPVLLSYGAALAAALSLTVVLLHTFPLPVIPNPLCFGNVALLTAAVVLFLLFPRAVVTTLERSRKSSPAALTGLLFSLLLPPLFFLLVIVVFTGNSSLFWAICFASSMTLSCLVAKLSFQLCGSRLHASVTAVIAALPAFPFLLFLA